MIAWYGEVLGMRPNFRSPVIAFLSNDAANHRLALIGLPGIVDDPEKVPHAGMHHSAFEYATLGELLETYKRLAILGIRPHMTLDHGLTTSLYYVDPDGNSVELQVDNFGDWAKSSEWIRSSPDFAADPIGKFCDPGRLVEAFEGGMSPAEIHDRSFAGYYAPADTPDLRLPTP
jgi:catechol-2,3-dioxygenase